MGSIRDELIREARIQAHICQSELTVWEDKREVVKQDKNGSEAINNSNEGEQTTTTTHSLSGEKSGNENTTSGVITQHGEESCTHSLKQAEDVYDDSISYLSREGNTSSSSLSSGIMKEKGRKRMCPDDDDSIKKKSGGGRGEDMPSNMHEQSSWSELMQLRQRTEELEGLKEQVRDYLHDMVVLKM